MKLINSNSNENSGRSGLNKYQSLLNKTNGKSGKTSSLDGLLKYRIANENIKKILWKNAIRVFEENFRKD
jgi:hypothetical protein